LRLRWAHPPAWLTSCAATADKETTTEDKDSKAHKAIWAAVALSAGMGVVPFGINIAWFFAVTTGLIVYLGELYGYAYTRRNAAWRKLIFVSGCVAAWCSGWWPA
jgi:hypothetical protein